MLFTVFQYLALLPAGQNTDFQIAGLLKCGHLVTNASMYIFIYINIFFHSVKVAFLRLFLNAFVKCLGVMLITIDYVQFFETSC